MQRVPADSAPSGDRPLVVGRYAIYDAIAAGGMATVHLGRLMGPVGFSRTVAIKRLHTHLASDPDFSTMFMDEARLAARIQHPNVVSTLDVVVAGNELLLVMDYVRGESLSRLVRRAVERGQRIPPRIVVAILTGALHGLHAAHEALDEKGQPLALVHRDMTPQNILVGADGVARVLDFGIAKAAGRVHTTKEGDIKGKVLYMPPEQLAAEPLTRAADLYATGVVLFEALTGVRMFAGDSEHASLLKIIKNEIRVPGEIVPELAVFDDVVRRSTEAEAGARYQTAREMAVAIEACMPPASPAEVSEWVQFLAGDVLDERARIVSEIERSTTRSKPPLSPTSEPSMPASGVTGRAALGVPTAPTVQVAAGAGGAGPPGAQAAPGPYGHPVGSDITSGVVAQPVKRSGGLAIGVAVLAVLLLSSFAVIAFLLRSRGAMVTSAGATTSSVPAATATEAAPPEPIRVAPAVRASAEPTAAPPPTSPSPDVTASAAKPVASASSSATKAVVKTGGGRSPVNCDPPYVVDKNGHRHFIPECVK